MAGQWLRRCRRMLRRFLTQQDGVTAIEFAMLAAPFLYLILAILETGILLFSEYVIEHGVGNAARMIRTGEVQTDGLTASEFKTLVCGSLATYLDCTSRLHVDVRAFDDFAGVALPDPLTDEGELSDDVTTNAQFQTGDPLDAVVVRTYYAWPLFTPGISHLANMTDGRRLLAAGAAFRNEPYPPPS